MDTAPNPTVFPENNPLTPEPPPHVVPSGHRPSVLVVFLVILLLGAFSFLFYKNMQLQKQIAALQITPSPTPISKTTPSDPTENWTEYTFSYAPLSFRYPSELVIEEKNPSASAQFRELLIKTNDSSLRIHPLQGPFGYENSDQYPESLVINGQTIVKNRMVNKTDGSQSYMIIMQYPNNSQGIFSVVSSYDYNDGQINPTDTKLFDQILSTFKFTSVNCTGTCPQLMPPAPNFCTNGTIVAGGVNECGCSLGPTCQTYTCPPSGYVDCMPGPDKDMSRCTQDAMSWYKANCPDFKGGAL